MNSQPSRIASRRSRPQQAWPPSRPTRQRSDVAQRIGRHVLRYAASNFLENESRSQGDVPQESQQGHQGQGSGRTQVVMDILVGQLLEEIIQYLIRHNFFLRRRNASRTSATRDVDQQQGDCLHSQSSYDQRRRHRRQRRTDAMMVSLDRLSTELEVTNDALLQVMHSSRNGPTENELLIPNADDLRRAIARSTARIESVRHHDRRAARHGSTARRDGRAPPRSTSQLHVEPSY